MVEMPSGTMIRLFDYIAHSQQSSTSITRDVNGLTGTNKTNRENTHTSYRRLWTWRMEGRALTACRGFCESATDLCAAS